MKTIIRNKLYVKGTSSSSGGGGGGSVVSVTGNGNIIVDNTDPDNPVISTTARDITVVANYSALPSAASANDEFYWCSASQGTSWLPGALGGTYYNSGLYYSNGVSWEYLNVPYNATLAEVDTGTNDTKFLTPSTFANAAKWATKENALTISTGLTRATNTITNDLVTGIAGGQTATFGTGATDKGIFKATTGNQTTGASNVFKFVNGNNGASELVRFGDGIAANIGEFSAWAAGQSSSTTHMWRAGTNFTYINAGTDLRLQVGAVSYINMLSGAGTVAIQKPLTFATGANVTLVAGSTTLAPLVFTSGTNKTTPTNGSMEYNGTNFFATRTGATRENIVCASAVNSVSPTSPNKTITVNIDGTTYYIAAKTTND